MSDYVVCGTCGRLIPDTQEENVDHKTRGHDAGFGECRECAGWAFDLVMQPIFAKVRDNLSEESQAKWDAMGDGAKTAFVDKMLDKGVLQWKIG